MMPKQTAAPAKEVQAVPAKAWSSKPQTIAEYVAQLYTFRDRQSVNVAVTNSNSKTSPSVEATIEEPRPFINRTQIGPRKAGAAKAAIHASRRWRAESTRDMAGELRLAIVTDIAHISANGHWG
jgi:hypothetical protein